MHETYEEVGGLIAQLLVNPATPPELLSHYLARQFTHLDLQRPATIKALCAVLPKVVEERLRRIARQARPASAKGSQLMNVYCR